MLLVVVAMMFFNWFVQPEQQPAWVLQAKSRPILMSIGERLVAVLPEDPEKAIMDQLKKRTSTQADGAGENENTGYSASERKGLEQLTTGGN